MRNKEARASASTFRKLAYTLLIPTLCCAQTPSVFKPTILLTNNTNSNLLYFYKGLQSKKKSVPSIQNAVTSCNKLSIPGLAYIPIKKTNMTITRFFQPVNVGCILIGKRNSKGKFEKLGVVVAAINWQQKTLTESTEKLNQHYLLTVSLEDVHTVVNATITNKTAQNPFAPKTIMVQFPYRQ